MVLIAKTLAVVADLLIELMMAAGVPLWQRLVYPLAGSIEQDVFENSGMLGGGADVEALQRFLNLRCAFLTRQEVMTDGRTGDPQFPLIVSGSSNGSEWQTFGKGVSL